MMSQLKNKYKREQSELINTLIRNGRLTAILEIKVMETSKIKEHLIYQCVYINGGKLGETHIIAKDITDAMLKLEPYITSGTPDIAINYILGKERFNES